MKLPSLLRPWTKREDATLRELWPQKPAPEIAKLLNRPRVAVSGRAARLGLMRPAKPAGQTV
jgi:hypothetical protein